MDTNNDKIEEIAKIQDSGTKIDRRLLVLLILLGISVVVASIIFIPKIFNNDKAAISGKDSSLVTKSAQYLQLKAKLDEDRKNANSEDSSIVNADLKAIQEYLLKSSEK